MVNIFSSEKTQEYVSKEILSQWNVATENEQDLYLESFYRLNPLKSLAILKKKIDGFSQVNFEISDEYFNSKSNYNTINSKEVSILSGYKNTSCFQEAIELLVEVLNKRPDWFMDIYFSFSSLTYDRSSYHLDYEKEYVLLEKLWSLREIGDNNFDFLIFKVVDELLACSHEITEDGDSPNSISFSHMSINLSEGTKQLRSLCWKILSELYKESPYQNKVLKTLVGNHWRGFEDYIIPIFEYDMQEVKKFFVDSWEELTFEQCLTLSKLVEFSVHFEVNIDEGFMGYKDNREYCYYEVIASNDRLERLSENTEKRIERIKSESKDFTLEDYKQLFSVAKKIEQKNKFIETYSIGENLSILVRNVDSEILPDILKLYFSFDAPFSGSLSVIVIDLLNSQGFDETFNLISQFDFPNRNIWINTMWTCLPKEMVSENQIALLIEHINSEGKNQNPSIPRFSDLLKFQNVDKLIVQKVSELIAVISESNQNIAQSFLLEFHNRPKELVEVFSKNIVILEKMYFSLQFDYQGLILSEIIKLDLAFWVVYTKQVDMSSFHNNYDKEIFKQIWILDNYNELIDVAYENIVAPSYNFYFSFGKHETIFPVDIGQDSIRNNHIKTWVLNFISKHSDNFEEVQNIFSVFVNNQNDEDKIQYIEKFLSCNKNYNDFMKLSLNPSSHSWSGSYVPIIEGEVNFWKKLLAQNFLKGIEFIEHKNSIGERINFLENKKKETLLREYQDDYLNP
nr:hypothetical protein A5866_000134 [Enterococcus sp. 12C11_DIV0727]